MEHSLWLDVSIQLVLAAICDERTPIRQAERTMMVTMLGPPARDVLGSKSVDSSGFEIDRRSLLLAAGTTATVALEPAISAKARAAGGSPATKIDAHTHFAPLKFLDFAEK